jgi:hypothetical protein
VYYVRVSSGNANAWGVSSGSELPIKVQVGGGKLVVIATDKLHPSQSPPGAEVVVDGIHRYSLNGALSLPLDLSPGIHTVQVPVVTGYLPEEDPAQPHQMTNKNSYLYGNPKALRVENDSWRFAVFQFIPYVQVSTGSLVRDRWTRERLSNAVIAFKATSGVISNVVYNGYPNFATNYKSYWSSQPDGTFPTNVWLPAVNYDLTLTKTHYSNGVLTNAINPMPGQTTDLGTLWLVPVDTNANGLADRWEERYFPSNRPPPTEDTDGDGHDNYKEYLVGTDPTNRESVMKLQIASQNTHGVTLTWPVVNGRLYQILTSGQLISNLWQEVFGPREAAYDQTQMQWTLTNTADQTHRFYRLKVP